MPIQLTALVHHIRSQPRLLAAWVGLLGAVATVGIIDMPAMFWSGDPVIWRIEARGILEGRLWVDYGSFSTSAEPGQIVVLNHRTGRWYSKYGIMNSLLLLPPTWLDRLTGGLVPPRYTPNLFIHNLWNVLLSVALAASLFKLTALYTQRLITRLLFVGVTLYCTYLWYYLRAQSSEINQVLFFTLFFYCFVRFLRDFTTGSSPPDGRGVRLLYLAWGCVAMLVLMRIVYLLLIPLLLLYVAAAIYRMPREQRRPVVLRILPHLLVPPLLIGVLLGGVNFIKFGSPFLTGYHQWRVQNHLPVGRWSEGLWGFFVSRRFGIFFHFPVLLFALLQCRAFIRRFPLDAAVAFGTAAVFILFIAKIPTWAGEWTYGPRYLIFILPVLSLPFILLIDWLLDHRHTLHTWLVSVMAAAVLLYSSYLQFRMNQVDFHLYYYFVQTLGTAWNEPVKQYFENNHVGMITDDLIRHRNDMDSLFWFQEMQKIWPPELMNGYRGIIQNFIRQGNHYWWSPEMGESG